MKSTLTLALVFALTVGLLGGLLSFGTFSAETSSVQVSSSDSIVGKWSLDTEASGIGEGVMTYDFGADGKLTITIDSGNPEVDKLANEMFSKAALTYEAKDGQLMIKSEDPSFPPLENAPYTIEGDALTFEGETLTRVK